MQKVCSAFLGSMPNAPCFSTRLTRPEIGSRITSYNVCYTKLLRNRIIFINSGNEHLNEMAKDNRNRIEYGVAGSRVWGSVNDQSSKLIVDWTSDGERYYQVKTNLIGSYNLENVLCAIAVGIQFNVDLESINRAINRYEPQNNRSQFIETECVITSYSIHYTKLYDL